MNYWVKIGAFAAATGLLVGLWYWDDVRSNKKQEQEKLEAKVFNIDKDKVRKMLIVYEGSPVSVWRENSTSDWKLVVPEKNIKLNQNAVTNVLNTIADLNYSMDLPDTDKVLAGKDTDKATYGLDNPKLAVVVTSEDKNVIALKIGKDLTIGTKTEASFNAVSSFAASTLHKNILVISTSSLASLKKTYSDFRTKNPVEFKVADVKSFVVTTDANTKIRGLKGDKDWTLTSPLQVLADNNGITNYLNTVTGIEVEKVIEKEAVQNLADYGLTTPSATLEFFDKDEKPIQKINIGKEKNMMYVTMADGSVGSFSLLRWKDLVPELKTFRDRKVVRDIAMADISRVRTKSGKIYTKEGTSWYPTETGVEALALPTPPLPSAPSVKAAAASPTPAGKIASSDAASFFSDWEFMNAENIVDNVQPKDYGVYGFDKPTQEFWFDYGDSKKKSEHFVVGKELSSDGKLRYVKRDGKDVAYVVEESWLSRLDKIDKANTLAHK